ncbi:MAG TPA: hypothetical protein VJH71_03790 [Candidatus Paceibacterota bacterium]
MTTEKFELGVKIQGSESKRPDFSTFSARAAEIASANLDLAHNGTHHDQRRINQLILMYESESKKRGEDPETGPWALMASRLKEAAKNNDLWLKARLESLADEDRHIYQTREDSLSSSVIELRKALDSYNYQEEKYQGAPVFGKLADGLGAAETLLKENELSLITQSEK